MGGVDLIADLVGKCSLFRCQRRINLKSVGGHGSDDSFPLPHGTRQPYKSARQSALRIRRVPANVEGHVTCLRLVRKKMRVRNSTYQAPAFATNAATPAAVCVAADVSPAAPPKI